MSWAGLASNQMVSYTDAQGGGFSLQSGQSSVTSDQCMTKNNALTKYVLDSASMASYSANQLVPKSSWVGGKAVRFSSWYQASGTSGSSTSGTVTIIGANATFNAFATVQTGSGVTCTTNITINGNSRSASKTGAGTNSSTTFTLTPGTYSYSVSCTLTGSGVFIGGINYTQ